MKKLIVLFVLVLSFSSCSTGFGRYVEESFTRNMGFGLNRVYIGMSEDEMRKALPTGYTVVTNTSKDGVMRTYVTKGMGYFFYCENGKVTYIQKY
jgi:hypothetical protein